jgi:hypothetical protein
MRAEGGSDGVGKRLSLLSSLIAAALIPSFWPISLIIDKLTLFVALSRRRAADARA